MWSSASWRKLARVWRESGASPARIIWSESGTSWRERSGVGCTGCWWLKWLLIGLNYAPVVPYNVPTFELTWK